MSERTNAGFRIIVSVPLAGNDTEIVIGYKQTSLGDQYVCWYCSGKTNYYWEKYCHIYTDALALLAGRLVDYLNIKS